MLNDDDDQHMDEDTLAFLFANVSFVHEDDVRDLFFNILYALMAETQVRETLTRTNFHRFTGLERENVLIVIWGERATTFSVPRSMIKLLANQVPHANFVRRASEASSVLPTSEHLLDSLLDMVALNRSYECIPSDAYAREYTVNDTGRVIDRNLVVPVTSSFAYRYEDARMRARLAARLVCEAWWPSAPQAAFERLLMCAPETARERTLCAMFDGLSRIDYGEYFYIGIEYDMERYWNLDALTPYDVRFIVGACNAVVHAPALVRSCYVRRARRVGQRVPIQVVERAEALEYARSRGLVASASALEACSGTIVRLDMSVDDSLSYTDLVHTVQRIIPDAFDGRDFAVVYGERSRVYMSVDEKALDALLATGNIARAIVDFRHDKIPWHHMAREIARLRRLCGAHECTVVHETRESLVKAIVQLDLLLERCVPSVSALVATLYAVHAQQRISFLTTLDLVLTARAPVVFWTMPVGETKPPAWCAAAHLTTAFDSFFAPPTARAPDAFRRHQSRWTLDRARELPFLAGAHPLYESMGVIGQAFRWTYTPPRSIVRVASVECVRTHGQRLHERLVAAILEHEPNVIATLARLRVGVVDDGPLFRAPHLPSMPALDDDDDGDAEMPADSLTVAADLDAEQYPIAAETFVRVLMATRRALASLGAPNERERVSYEHSEKLRRTAAYVHEQLRAPLPENDRTSLLVHRSPLVVRFDENEFIGREHVARVLLTSPVLEDSIVNYYRARP